ncbi:MAG: hypothetical protein DRO88_08925 [Promethearchaeia archaeon]|nr:MAG: hypothetical protein DRO88_08925 [Candidatus Lokiarchaeia archaeon]
MLRQKSLKNNSESQTSQLNPLPFPIKLLKKVEHKFDLLPRTNFFRVQTYIWLVFSALVVVSIVAQILYPVPFSFLSNTISDQGSPQLNPLGSIFWRIGVIINGLAHIPYLLYLAAKFQKFNSVKARQFKRIGIFAAIGFSTVGIFPLDLGTIHYIMALIAFLGYYRAANLSFEIIIGVNSQIRYKFSLKIKTFNLVRLFKLYFRVSGALCLGSFLINKLIFQKDVSAILEWNYLLAICLWLLMWPAIIHEIESNLKP